MDIVNNIFLTLDFSKGINILFVTTNMVGK